MYYVLVFLYKAIVLVLIAALIYILYLAFDSKKAKHVFISIDTFFRKRYNFKSNIYDYSSIAERSLDIYYTYYFNPLKRKDRKILEKALYGGKYLTDREMSFINLNTSHDYENYVYIYCLIICEEAFCLHDSSALVSEYKLFHFFNAFSAITDEFNVPDDYNFSKHIQWLMFEVYELEFEQRDKNSFCEYYREKYLVAPYLCDYWKYNKLFSELLLYFYKNKAFDTRDNVVSIIYNDLLPDLYIRGLYIRGDSYDREKNLSLKRDIEIISKNNNISLTRN